MTNRGQISLGVSTAIAAVSFIAAPIVAYFSSQAAVDEKISALSERTAVLETSIPEIRDNIQDIKDSVNNMEDYFRIPKPK